MNDTVKNQDAWELHLHSNESVCHDRAVVSHHRHDFLLHRGGGITRFDRCSSDILQDYNDALGHLL